MPRRALRTRNSAPTRPGPHPAGYSGTPLPAKLGIKPASTVALIDAPEGFDKTLGKLPPGAVLARNPKGMQTLTLWFITSLHDYRSRLRSLAESTERIWIIWPKKSSGVPTDLSEQSIRDAGLAIGMVDYKVCAVDATWSGLLFTRRKTK